MRQPKMVSRRETQSCCGCELLARAQGDEVAYSDYRDRFRAIATSLGFEGHVKWAEAMP